MLIQTKDYEGECRRTNGARIKMSIRDIVWIAVIAGTIILSIGSTGWTAKNNKDDIKELSTDVKINSTEIAVLKTKMDIVVSNTNKILNKLIEKNERHR